MFDYTREYAEFKNYVERIYTAPEEKARITEEFALFEQRGWQNYIVLLPKIIKQIERNARSSYSYSICDKDGTLYDSYAILKFIEVDFEPHDFLRDHKNKKGPLFKNPLSLTFHIKPSREDFNFDHMDHCMDSIIRDSGLCYVQRTLKNVVASQPDTPIFQEDLYVFSASTISASNIDQISKESRYFLIKFTTAPKEKTPYEELKSRALSACTNPDDTRVVQDELDYLEQRGWQKYFVVIARMLEKLKEEEFDPYESYFHVPCFITLGRLLENRHFNLGLFDEFYVDLVIEDPRNGDLNGIEKILDYSSQGLGLHSKKFKINDHTEAVIISKPPIYTKDLELIAKEHGQCSPEERERLSRFLIIKIVHPTKNEGWN